MGDGLITAALEPDVVASFQQSGAGDKPRYGRFEVCWAEDEAEARRLAHRWWRSAGISGQAKRDLALPAHFRELADFVSEDYVSRLILCGPDPAPHVEKVRSFIEAGYTHVSVHQVTPDQEGFFHFYEREVFPQLIRNGLMAEVGRTVAASVGE